MTRAPADPEIVDFNFDPVGENPNPGDRIQIEVTVRDTATSTADGEDFNVFGCLVESKSPQFDKPVILKCQIIAPGETVLVDDSASTADTLDGEFTMPDEEVELEVRAFGIEMSEFDSCTLSGIDGTERDLVGSDFSIQPVEPQPTFSGSINNVPNPVTEKVTVEASVSADQSIDMDVLCDAVTGGEAYNIGAASATDGGGDVGFLLSDATFSGPSGETYDIRLFVKESGTSDEFTLVDRVRDVTIDFSGEQTVEGTILRPVSDTMAEPEDVSVDVDASNVDAVDVRLLAENQANLNTFEIGKTTNTSPGIYTYTVDGSKLGENTQYELTLEAKPVGGTTWQESDRVTFNADFPAGAEDVTVTDCSFNPSTLEPGRTMEFKADVQNNSPQYVSAALVWETEAGVELARNDVVVADNATETTRNVKLYEDLSEIHGETVQVTSRVENVEST